MVNKKSMRNIKRKSNKQSKRNLRRSSNKLSRKSVKQQMGGGNSEFLNLLTAAGITGLEKSTMDNITRERAALQLESIKKGSYGPDITTQDDLDKLLTEATSAAASVSKPRPTAVSVSNPAAVAHANDKQKKSEQEILDAAKAESARLEAATIDVANKIKAKKLKILKEQLAALNTTNNNTAGFVLP